MGLCCSCGDKMLSWGLKVVLETWLVWRYVVVVKGICRAKLLRLSGYADMS